MWTGGRRRRERGSSVLYAVILSPVLLLSLALAVEVGGLQLQRQRLVSALDQSVVVAGSVAARAGTAAGLDPQAAVAALRASLVENITPLDATLSGATPLDVALAAEVAVVTTVPGADPFGGPAAIRRPAIEARIHVPVRTGLLAAAGLPTTTVLTLTARADLSFIGAVG